jgi:signal transduction histidine kinase
MLAVARKGTTRRPARAARAGSSRSATGPRSRSWRRDEPHDLVELSIHNEGPRIPTERLGQIFEPLQRATDQIDVKTRSVGLGVYIVDAIARAHGGTVGVVSIEGAGTTFTVQLPGELRASPRS